MVLPGEFVEAFLAALQPIVPGDGGASLRARLLQRVADDAKGGDELGIATVSSSAGQWLPYAPGIMAKVLIGDERMRTMLVRMEMNASLAPHVHDGDEECFVLEGSCVMGGSTLKSGDYQLARAGSRHGDVFSATGCLLFVRSTLPEAVEHA